MDLRTLVERRPLEPGARLPWEEPDFSARMLREHLNEHHDLASRRPAIIDAQVGWIGRHLPSGPARVLDLGCGPGLHLERFAAAGWTCVGVDIAPAAIEHARSRQIGTYVLGDVRTVEVAGTFDLVLLLFGELSTFEPDDVSIVLGRIASWLAPGGRAVLEVSTSSGVQRKGTRAASWYTDVSGLFADDAHVVLREAWLDTDAAIERWWVIAQGAAEARAYTSTTWLLPNLESQIASSGLTLEERYGDLTGAPVADDDDFVTLILRSSRS